MSVENRGPLPGLGRQEEQMAGSYEDTVLCGPCQVALQERETSSRVYTVKLHPRICCQAQHGRLQRQFFCSVNGGVQLREVRHTQVTKQK